MNRRSNSLIVLCLGAALGLAALPAVAGDKEKQWNRGCADAKAGTYDRAKHNEHYEKGWQACNQQKQSSSASGQPTRNMQEADDYSRGCQDAKAGSYDRAHPTAAYERGWQSCKGSDSADEGANRQKEWDRGCADSKAKTYDRARHNADYEAGWSACKSN
ncbi:MAG TPA: hypothetical protein PLE54_06120 [Burkholderiaceae bacterium]|nr:hypothetical protein [Burkholderiaceae bacterium]